MRRLLPGVAVGVGSTLLLGAVLIPLRSQLSIATVGLILVVPVVLAVATGGLIAGVAGVAAGFLTFDYAFIPPYYTLSVGAGQNWVALGVYAVVMLLVARVFSRLQRARAEAQSRAADARRLLEVSELLVTDRSLGDLLQSIVGTVGDVFGVAGVALLLPDGDRLEVAAAAGASPTPEELGRLRPQAGLPVAVGARPVGPPGSGLRAVSLAAAGRPVGILAMRGLPARGADRDLLQTFANQAALAIERGKLREQAIRSQLLEELDRVRQGLLGAVSHDLRTPLATMKVAASALLDSEAELTAEGRRDLYRLIDIQTDRLSRLVAGLLDVTRYRAGALQVHPAPVALAELVDDAVAGIGPSLTDREIVADLGTDLPEVCCDRLLIGQVLVNLVDNADRHAPPGTPISVGARLAVGEEPHSSGERVEVWVADGGPGIPPGEQEAVFDRFARFDSGGRTGLGLWICRTFVEAHGGVIRAEDVAEGGARFVFTVPIARSCDVQRLGPGCGEPDGIATPDGTAVPDGTDAGGGVPCACPQPDPGTF